MRSKIADLMMDPAACRLVAEELRTTEDEYRNVGWDHAAEVVAERARWYDSLADQSPRRSRS